MRKGVKNDEKKALRKFLISHILHIIAWCCMLDIMQHCVTWNILQHGCNTLNLVRNYYPPSFILHNFLGLHDNISPPHYRCRMYRVTHADFSFAVLRKFPSSPTACLLSVKQKIPTCDCQTFSHIAHKYTAPVYQENSVICHLPIRHYQVEVGSCVRVNLFDCSDTVLSHSGFVVPHRISNTYVPTYF